MARAETASASIRSDSIKGLAQSIAKPAYRRLLTAEPALRRAVPALIIAFLLTICIGAFVQVLDHRRQVIGELFKHLEAGADIMATPARAVLTSKSFFIVSSSKMPCFKLRACLTLQSAWRIDSGSCLNIE